jgi:hypothetical protein
MRFTILAILLLGIPCLLQAHAYSGRVIDKITGEGLPGASLSGLSGESARTDEQGFFTLDCEQPKVLIQMPGFQDKSHILRKKDNLIALELQGVYDIPAVEVKAKPDAKKVIVSKQSLEKEAIQKTTTSLFPDVAKVVQTLPGVTTNSDFSSLLYVRGGNPDEVVAILDDMLIMSPYIWGGRLSVFNPNLVESVDFYAGGFPAEANQAMSALLDVKNKTGNPRKYAGFMDLSAATAEALAEGPLGITENSSFILGLRRTHYDLIINSFADDNTVYPYFWDGQAKLTLPLPHGALTFQSLYSYQGMHLLLSETEGFGDDHGVETSSQYLNKKCDSSLAYNHQCSDTISVMTLLGLSLESGFFTLTDFYSPLEANFDQSLLQLRHVWQILLGDNHIVKAGLYAITGHALAKVDITRKIPTRDGYYIKHIATDFNFDWPVFAGGFIQDDMELLKDSLYLNPGINLQYYSGNQQMVVNPRLGVKWQVLPDWEWHAAAGIYSQHPMEPSRLDQEYGNPGLLAQEAVHYILGSRIDLGRDFFIQGEFFYKDYNHLMVSDADPDINYTNNGEGYAYGFDIIFQKKLGGPWDGWLTYSYVSSQRKITARSDPLDFGMNQAVVPLNEWYTPESERPHALSLVLNYTVSGDWKLALTQKYMSGCPYTPVTGAYYVAAIDEYVPEYGDINSARLPDFFTTDIKLSMPFFGLKGWSSYVQTSNLFGNKNVDSYYYNEDYSEKRALYQLPRMIIGGIRWEF